MIYPILVTLNVQSFKKGLKVRLQLTAQLLNLGITPFFAFGLGLMFYRIIQTESGAW